MRACRVPAARRTRPPVPGAVLTLALCGLLGLPSLARAGGDFDPDSGAWNGLAYLRATAREAGVDLRVLTELDFGGLRPGEVLFVLAPKVGLTPASGGELLRFVAGGGRLVIADDFRAGRGWMRPFGVELVERPGPVQAHDAGRANLPVMTEIDEPELASKPPPMNRFLGFEVERVVLNHPASLIAARTPPLGFRLRDRGPYLDGVRSWMIEAIGEAGRVLAIADSSIFINGMLRRHRGNKQFAANVLRYYCLEGRPCEVALVVGATRVFGRLPPPVRDRADPRVPVGDPREAARAAVSTLASILRSPALRPMLWLIALLGLGLPIILAARVPDPLLPPRLAGGRPASLLSETVRAWLASPGADYRRPARQLALYLGRLVAQVEQPHDGPGGAERTSPSGLGELPRAIETLVEHGQLSEQAGARVCDIVRALHEVAGEEPVEMDRRRFTQLAAEVEWAEHVLSHTVRAG